MKAKLEFDLNDSDDCLRHRQCIAAEELAQTLWSYIYDCQSKLTAGYGQTDSYTQGLQAAYKQLNDLLEANNLNIKTLSKNDTL